MHKKILVPLDGSDLSERALPLACELVEASKAELILLRIIEYPYSLYPPDYAYPPFDPDLGEVIAQKKRSVADEIDIYMKQVLSAIGDAGTKVSAEVCEGAVVETILDCINRLRVNLVVLSAYGQGGGRQETIGAVANRLLRESQAPVILVRPARLPVDRASNAISAVRTRMELPQHHRFARTDQTLSARRSRHLDTDSDQLPTGA